MEAVLQFYSNFDEKIYGIDLNHQDIFYLKSKPLEGFVDLDRCLEVKDPLADGRITTKNCYKFKEIK